MVSELSGATPWEFVNVFPCEDICEHHPTGQKRLALKTETVFGVKTCF